MVQQLEQQAIDDLAVLTVDQDRKADVLLRNQHHGGEESEYRAAMPDDLGAAVIPHIPAQRVGIEHGLREFQIGRARGDRLQSHRQPHLARAPRR